MEQTHLADIEHISRSTGQVINAVLPIRPLAWTDLLQVSHYTRIAFVLHQM